MKTLIFSSIILSLSLASFSSSAKLRAREERAYITEKTYIRSEQAVYHSCLKEVQDAIFCSCAAQSVNINMMLVVEIEGIVFEDELMNHVDEIRLSDDQDTSCRGE
jgi:hypothetical protein